MASEKMLHFDNLRLQGEVDRLQSVVDTARAYYRTIRAELETCVQENYALRTRIAELEEALSLNVPPPSDSVN